MFVRGILALTMIVLPLLCAADQTDQRLEGLFVTLKSSEDTMQLLETEAAIWNIWYESGDDAIDELMLQAAEMVSSGDLSAAETVYSEVIEKLPRFSEGWNRRATVRYYQGDFEASLQDIEQTLILEPRHFGAIWGLGMILGSQREFEAAILAFQRLLEIKPNSLDALPRIELLRQEMAKESI